MDELWVIRSIDEPHLLWNNDEGWTEGKPTIFIVLDKTWMNKPIAGKWEKYNG